MKVILPALVYQGAVIVSSQEGHFRVASIRSLPIVMYVKKNENQD
jgi:hypothetical protein